jgi:hypothetical protein
MVGQRHKDRAINFVQINTPLLKNMNELTATEEKQLSADSEFIGRRLEASIWLTAKNTKVNCSMLFVRC